MSDKSGRVTPNSTLIGIFGILPNIRKKGENPVVCDIVQLYACVSVATHSDHDFLACGGRVPNILMRVALNCSQLPFVCGLCCMVHNFCTSAKSHNSLTNWFSNDLPWSVIIFSGHP